jgi:hypothetical protein
MTARFTRSILLPLSLCVLASAACSTNAQSPSNPVTQSAPEKANPSASTGTVQTRPVLEPKAVEILKAACARLAAAHSMSFTAIVTYENPSRFGFPLAYGTTSDVLLQRPNKLRVITPGDGPASEFYYDGKTMMAFSPAENLLAVADAPPTVDAMLETAFHSAAIYFPFDDVIVTDPYKDLSQDLRVAFYIGKSNLVGGTTTDVVAYDSGGVFIQAWIGVEDKLPRMLRAIYVDDPLQLRHVLLFSNWKLDVTVPAGSFGSAKAGNAKHIPFASPNSAAAPKPKTNP